MYKLIDDAKEWEPLPGIPWRDLSDDEFAEVSAEYDKQFPDQPGSLLRWFHYAGPEPKTSEARVIEVLAEEAFDEHKKED